MIKSVKFGNLLKSTEHHIAFAINKEALSDTKMLKDISQIWPELKNENNHDLGTVITKEIDDKIYHAMVCYSSKTGWKNQKEVIKMCLDQIDTSEIIAIEEIGAEKKNQKIGANPIKLKQQMQTSPKQLILYRNI